MKKKLLICLLCLFFIWMFFFPSVVITGAREGLLLWYRTMMPTLLPFLIITQFFIRSGLIARLRKISAPFLGRLGLDATICYVIFCGFLCGYPMGAKTVADFVRAGELSVSTGQYLLGFCNNASPAFLLTYICTETLQRPDLRLPSVIILYGSAFFQAVFFRFFYKKKRATTQRDFHVTKHASLLHKKKISSLRMNPETLDICIINGFETMIRLGGYIMLFSVLSAAISRLPENLHAVKYGSMAVTEIVCGIQAIGQSEYPLFARYLCILSTAAFGGLSGIAQTAAVIKGSGLSIRKYMLSKVLCTCTTGLFCLLFFLS